MTRAIIWCSAIAIVALSFGVGSSDAEARHCRRNRCCGGNYGYGYYQGGYGGGCCGGGYQTTGYYGGNWGGNYGGNCCGGSGSMNYQGAPNTNYQNNNTAPPPPAETAPAPRT